VAQWEPLADRIPVDVRRLATQLRRMKDRSGLTVPALAARTAQSAETWERALAGRRLPPLDAVEVLAQASGADYDRIAALWELAEKAAAGTGDRVRGKPVPYPDPLDPLGAAEGLPGRGRRMLLLVTAGLLAAAALVAVILTAGSSTGRAPAGNAGPAPSGPVTSAEAPGRAPGGRAAPGSGGPGGESGPAAPGRGSGTGGPTGDRPSVMGTTSPSPVAPPTRTAGSTPSAATTAPSSVPPSTPSTTPAPTPTPTRTTPAPTPGKLCLRLILLGVCLG
jgi:hypothetical protein